MPTQQIRYCTTPNGAQIAYATSGSGPPLVKAANWLNHLEFDWESPVWRHVMREFSRHFTFVRYDERGNGLSDWDVDDISFEAFVADLEAVVDAAGLEKFSLLGISQGCAVSVAYAVRHPERVDKLVLHGGFALGSLRRTEEERERRRALITLAAEGWGKETGQFQNLFAEYYLPEANAEEKAAWAALQRVATPHENADRIIQAMGNIDVMDLLPQVTAPTLVTHCRGEVAVPFSCARDIAAGIPGARLITLDSRNHLVMEGEPAWPKFLTEVLTFLGVDPAETGGQRAPVTAASSPTALEPGMELHHYRITEHIATGGMGAVYRAHDENLRRDVAIKVLPPDFAQDEERLARFEREARLLASLNHPNIAAIYGLETMGDSRFIVMELAEGETLKRGLEHGPLPVIEALQACGQIARALEAAHAKGIVHRDLKPSNVIISAGAVKVLDFGIAKAVVDATAMATLADAGAGSGVESDQLTRSGVVLGTGPYMSPEQVRGQQVGTYTDVWTFGCVLYEVLCGRSPFVRETFADTLTALLERDPDWSALPDGTPAAIRDLLSRALEKEPGRRLHDIGEARATIETALADTSDDASPGLLGRIWKKR